MCAKIRCYRLSYRQIMRATFTHLIGPQKGNRTKFDTDRISVGRAPDNMLCLGDGARRVSSHHAEVIQRGDQYLLRDLGSTNGTMINGRRVVVSEFASDDLIEFGAGGPLLRFGIERPGEEDQVETVSTDQRESERVRSAAAVQNEAVKYWTGESRQAQNARQLALLQRLSNSPTYGDR